MSILNCCCGRASCTLTAVAVSAVLGILAAFLQITGTIAVPAMFLMAAAGIAVVYLPVVLGTAALVRRENPGACLCTALNAALAGILGTILFAVILLAVDIPAAGVLSGILVGLLTFSLALTLTGTACLTRCLVGCED